ncbi:ssDNA-binding protein [uncultured Megasphaera sp.]|nr:ssDNA-binding protein [uncultured Megasphaera sp.]
MIKESVGKFGGKQSTKADIKLSFRDGDRECDDEVYKGYGFLNANSTKSS